MEKAIKINNKEEYLGAKEILIKKGFKSDEAWNDFVSNDMIRDKSQHYLIIYNNNNVFKLHNHNGSSEVIYENINEFLKDNENREL